MPLRPGFHWAKSWAGERWHSHSFAGWPQSKGFSFRYNPYGSSIKLHLFCSRSFSHAGEASNR